MLCILGLFDQGLGRHFFKKLWLILAKIDIDRIEGRPVVFFIVLKIYHLFTSRYMPSHVLF